MEFERTNKFKRQYRRKPQNQKDKIKKTLKLLAQDIRYPGLHTSKVQGIDGIWECYVDDSMRITFEYGKGCIILRNNCKHDISSTNP